MKRLNRQLGASALLAIPAAAAAATLALIIRQRRTSMKFERLGAAALETLLNAIDANDAVTGAHVRRVARYALVLTDAMGADEHTAHTVERVALFHDIGKIHEALFDVIHDFRKLDPKERREINTHPARGATVLEPLSSFYPDLAKGVVAHHERWDGTGYPRRLKGREIPLSARVVAIADTFDAITHSRRYRRGRSLEIGMQALAEGRGTQFDPDLVDLFMAPPIVERIRDEMRGANVVDHGPVTRRRKHRGKPDHAPDVRFRWRDTSPRQSGRNRIPAKV